MNQYIFITMLLLHWFADFVLQTHEQAMNKSSRWDALLAHTIIYSLMWFVPVFATMSDGYGHISNLKALFFIPITFICHTVTDYITSREAKKFFDKKDYHNGFVVVGIDQILHYLQLFYTAKLLNII